MSTQTQAHPTIDTRVLNSLIETLKDGESGFKAAAADVSDPKLKNIFEKYSSQRHSFALELQKHVRQEGETPEDSGSIAGAAHRGWMSVKSVVSANDDFAILEECERGEDSALKAYHEASANTKLGAAATIIRDQRNDIKKAHDDIRMLRDRHKPKAV